MKKTLLAWIWLLMLSGCATQQLELPDMGIINREQMLEDFSVDSMWWKAYGDSQLNALVTEALENNIDLARSAITVNRALYQARQQGANLAPSFSAGQNSSLSKNLESGNSSDSYSANLGLSYELDLWGKLRNAASAQEWEYLATVEDKEAARLALVNNTVKAYFNLLYTRQALAASQGSLDFYQQLADITTERNRVGKIDGLEVVTAQQALLAERNNLLNLETQIKTSEQTIRNLLNMRPDDALTLETINLLSLKTAPLDLEVPLQALGLRPDVKAAEYRLQRAYNNLGAEQASLYPSISIGSTLSSQASNLGDIFSVPILGASIKLNLPFLNWNTLRWNIKISEEQLRDAELAFSQKITTALNELDVYYFSYLQALRQYQNSQAKYETDRELAIYRQRRYEAGVDELRDWLQARNTENASYLAMLRAKYSVIEYENAVYQAMGGRLNSKPYQEKTE